MGLKTSPFPAAVESAVFCKKKKEKQKKNCTILKGKRKTEKPTNQPRFLVELLLHYSCDITVIPSSCTNHTQGFPPPPDDVILYNPTGRETLSTDPWLLLWLCVMCQYHRPKTIHTGSDLIFCCQDHQNLLFKEYILNHRLLVSGRGRKHI